MILTNNQTNDSTLFSKIQQVVNKNFSRNFEREQEKVKELFTRGGVVPMGQIYHRSTITANNYAGTQVARPEGQQRAKNLIEELGVKYLQELTANFEYPRIDNNTSEWVNENEEGNVNNTTFESVSLRPRRLFTYLEYSNELVLNPNTDISGAIEEDVINSIMDKVQTTMFNEIYDATNAETITSVNDIVSFELSASNKKINNGIYLISPIAASRLKTMLNGTMPIYNNGMINGYKAIETPSLEGDKIIFGDFTKLLLGQWGAMDVLCDNITAQNRGVIKLICNNYFNWGIIDPNAFVFAKTASN